jgi:hypothetical protein
MIEHIDAKSLDQISGCRNLFAIVPRAEGPIANRPGRKAGQQVDVEMSTEGAAHNNIEECRSFSAHSLIPLLPGLAAGSIGLRLFEPHIKLPKLDKPRLTPGIHMLLLLEGHAFVYFNTALMRASPFSMVGIDVA